MFSVDITLDGKTVTLPTSLRAAKAMNNLFGNYLDALRHLSMLEHSSYVAIVAAALDKQPKDVEEQVYATGLPNLTDHLTTYVESLAWGGKDPAVEKAKKAEKDKAAGES